MTNQFTILAKGLKFPEGPVLLPDGPLVVTEIPRHRLTKIGPTGEVSLFSACGGGPNGLAIGPDGALYLCNNGGNRYVEGNSMGVGPHPDYKHGSVQRVDVKSGEATTLYTEVHGNLLSAPNDLVFDKYGGFYFTDMGKRLRRHRDNGGVYYALPDGSQVSEIAYPILSPNGCGLSPDGKILYVADTEGARLFAFDIEAPGVLRPPPRNAAHSGRVIAGLPGNAKFDSLAVLANGNIVVATLFTGYITEFAPNGDIVRAVKTPDIYPTNLCFGGPDMQTAFVTFSDAGEIATARWPTPGLKLNY